MVMNYIKRKDTMIVWNLDDDCRLTEICVYEYTADDRSNYETRGWEIAQHYKRFRYSNGNCSADWNTRTKDQLIAHCFKIIFDYKPIDLQKCLFELGKIDELECMRDLLFRLFPDLYPDHSYEEFLKELYLTKPLRHSWGCLKPKEVL